MSGKERVFYYRHYHTGKWTYSTPTIALRHLQVADFALREWTDGLFVIKSRLANGSEVPTPEEFLMIKLSATKIT